MKKSSHLLIIQNQREISTDCFKLSKILSKFEIYFELTKIEDRSSAKMMPFYLLTLEILRTYLTTRTYQTFFRNSKFISNLREEKIVRVKNEVYIFTQNQKKREKKRSETSSHRSRKIHEQNTTPIKRINTSELAIQMGRGTAKKKKKKGETNLR